MGSLRVDFRLQGRRSVKLAGSENSLDPILVDNFLLSGIFPRSIQNPGVQYYRAYGTRDSTIGGSESISFRNTPIAVSGFDTGGTSTIAALDITQEIQTNVTYTVDVRALDCGSQRALSSIYIVFQ